MDERFDPPRGLQSKRTFRHLHLLAQECARLHSGKENALHESFRHLSAAASELPTALSRAHKLQLLNDTKFSGEFTWELILNHLFPQFVCHLFTPATAASEKISYFTSLAATNVRQLSQFQRYYRVAESLSFRTTPSFSTNFHGN